MDVCVHVCVCVFVHACVRVGVYKIHTCSHNTGRQRERDSESEIDSDRTQTLGQRKRIRRSHGGFCDALCLLCVVNCEFCGQFIVCSE